MGGSDTAPLFANQHMVAMAGNEVVRKQWKVNHV